MAALKHKPFAATAAHVSPRDNGPSSPPPPPPHGTRCSCSTRIRHAEASSLRPARDNTLSYVSNNGADRGWASVATRHTSTAASKFPAIFRAHACSEATASDPLSSGRASRDDAHSSYTATHSAHFPCTASACAASRMAHSRSAPLLATPVAWYLVHPGSWDVRGRGAASSSRTRRQAGGACGASLRPFAQSVEGAASMTTTRSALWESRVPPCRSAAGARESLTALRATDSDAVTLPSRRRQQTRQSAMRRPLCVPHASSQRPCALCRHYRGNRGTVPVQPTTAPHAGGTVRTYIAKQPQCSHAVSRGIDRTECERCADCPKRTSRGL
eukprot:Opistho-2@73952